MFKKASMVQYNYVLDYQTNDNYRIGILYP